MDKLKPEFIKTTLFSILNFCKDDASASLLLNDLNLDESLFVINVKTATDTKKFNFLTEELQNLMMTVIKEKTAHKNWRLSLQETVSSINKIRSIQLSKIPNYAAKPKIQEPQPHVKYKPTSTGSAQTAAQYVASKSTTETKHSMPNKQSNYLEPKTHVQDKQTSTASAQTAAQYVASYKSTINNKCTVKGATNKYDLPNFSRGMYKQQVRLLEGMSEPVECERGMRIMQLMGWKGGALGIRGEGITEPIAPPMYLKPYAGFGAEHAVNQIHADQPKTKNKNTEPEKREKLKSSLFYDRIKSRLHELCLRDASEITELSISTLSKKEKNKIRDLINSLNLRNPHNVTKDLGKVFEFMSGDMSVGLTVAFQARAATIRKVHIDKVLTSKQKNKILKMMPTTSNHTVEVPKINQNSISQIYTHLKLISKENGCRPTQNGDQTYKNSAQTNEHGVQIFHNDVKRNQNGIPMVQNGSQQGAHATQNGIRPNQNAVETISNEVFINHYSFYRVEELLNIRIGTKKKHVLRAYKYLILEIICDFVKKSDTEVIINFHQVLSKNLSCFLETLINNINKRLRGNLCDVEMKIHIDILNNILDGCTLDINYHNSKLKIRLRKVFAASKTHDGGSDSTICNRSIPHESLTAESRSSSCEIITKTPELIILDSEDETEVNSFNTSKCDFTCDTNLNLIPVLNNVKVDLELPEKKAVISVFPDEETEFDKELRELEMVITETGLSKNDCYTKRNRSSSSESNHVIPKKTKLDINSDVKYIFIVPKKYPLFNIDRDTVNSLQNLICSSINETTDNLPLLECHGIQNGALTYCCHNEETYCWMKAIIAEFELDMTEFLDIIKTKSSQVVSMKINTCVDHDIGGILKNINVYYPDLDLLFWWLVKKQVTENSVVFVMEIDRKSLEFIYLNNFSLFVGFDKAHFSIVWDM